MACLKFSVSLALTAAVLALCSGHVIPSCQQADDPMQCFCRLTRDLRSHPVLRNPLRSIRRDIHDNMRQEHVDMAQYVNQTNTFDQHRTIENMANDLHQAFTDVTCMREALHQCSHSNVTGVLHVLHQLHLLVLEATGRQGEAVPMPRCHSNRWECRQWKEHPEMSLSFGFHVVSAALHFADTMAEECDRVAPHLE